MFCLGPSMSDIDESVWPYPNMRLDYQYTQDRESIEQIQVDVDHDLCSI